MSAADKNSIDGINFTTETQMRNDRDGGIVPPKRINSIK